MTLTPDEFIRRFLIHVLPSGFHRIRHYGFLANSQRKQNIAQARQLLGVVPPPPQPQPAEDTPAADSTAKPSLRPCPCCGGRMFVIEVFARARTPRYRATAPVRDTDHADAQTSTTPAGRVAASIPQISPEHRPLDPRSYPSPPSQTAQLAARSTPSHQATPSNPHRPSLLDLASSPAVCFFEGFRTPAGSACGSLSECRRPASENLHKNGPQSVAPTATPLSRSCSYPAIADWLHSFAEHCLGDQGDPLLNLGGRYAGRQSELQSVDKPSSKELIEMPQGRSVLLDPVSASRMTTLSSPPFPRQLWIGCGRRPSNTAWNGHSSVRTRPRLMSGSIPNLTRVVRARSRANVALSASFPLDGGNQCSPALEPIQSARDSSPANRCANLGVSGSPSPPRDAKARGNSARAARVSSASSWNGS
jgi:hypothetical protein